MTSASVCGIKDIMKSVYRIIISPYHYEFWDFFTEDKDLFDKLKDCDTMDDARTTLGSEAWDNLVDNYETVNPPYILLDELQLRQYD